jgi:group I intron endonuclease
MKCGVYLIHNILNNKVYVGKSVDIIRRWREHISTAYSPNAPKYPLQRAIVKYGKDNFVFAILQTFDNEIMALEAEKYWTQYYRSTDGRYGYNLTNGGIGSLSGYHHTTESKEKMRISQTGKIRTHQHRINIGLGRLGVQHTASTIEKLSGENSTHAKLTDELVKEIRVLYSTRKYSHRALAKMFNISKTQITNILNNKQWKNNE